MFFALTQEVSELIIKNGVSDHITNFSNSLSDFLSTKNYGDDLTTIYIGIICVSPEFEFFFKIRRPKYKKGDESIFQDGRQYLLRNFLTYDVKLDYKRLVEANEIEVKRILSTEVINSLSALNVVKTTSFDRIAFENDIKEYLDL